MTPYDGTQQWHHPAMAPWCHVQSAKVVRRPPPLLEVRTPIAIAIWGNTNNTNNNNRNNNNNDFNNNNDNDNNVYILCFHCLPFQVMGFYHFLIFHICNVSPELVFSTCHFCGLTESMQAIGVGISSNLREIHMANGWNSWFFHVEAMARSHFHLTVSTLDLSTPLVPRGGLSARYFALAAERSATASWLPTTSHSVVARFFPKFLEQSGVELGSR